MSRRYLIGTLLLLFGLFLALLAGCTDSWPTRLPEAATPTRTVLDPTSAAAATSPLVEATPAGSGVGERAGEEQPSDVMPELLVGAVTGTLALSNSQVDMAQLFPITEILTKDLFVDSVSILEDESLDGVVRLALAHLVPEPYEPFSTTVALEWVLLVPEGAEETAVAWQEVARETRPDGGVDSIVIRREAEQVIPFEAATDPMGSVAGLLDAVDGWSDPTGTGRRLWVDFVVIEEYIAGAKRWSLLVFSEKEPGTPAGWQKKKIICCNWFGCGRSASRNRWAICRTATCKRLCR